MQALLNEHGNCWHGVCIREENRSAVKQVT